ncbi:MAG: transcription-repair coupling factor, partial [Gammaproteobacteria bacterium]|nr:transcription-repair coupling factor [Gammaproteobacteria bacterium]
MKIQVPPDGQRSRWINASGSVGTLTLARLAQTTRSLFVVVANDSDNVYRIQNELEFFAPDLDVHSFPDQETLPYDSMSPQIDVISERLSTLYRMPSLTHGVLVLPVRALLQKLAPTEYVQSTIFTFKQGDHFDVSARRKALTNAGYRNVVTVYERGEYATRGAIFDIFPVGTSRPIRIELFDDEIETLRHFDPETQLTTERVTSVDFLPTKEFPLNERGISNFRNQWHREFNVDVRDCRDYQDVSDGIA